MATVEAAHETSRLTELMLDFLAYLELERGLSRNTLEAYRTDLQQYGVFLARQEIDPLRAHPPDLAAFVSELAEGARSEEHTSELQSQFHLVCRLLLEK